jgi:carboxylate-amine ligase
MGTVGYESEGSFVSVTTGELVPMYTEVSELLRQAYFHHESLLSSYELVTPPFPHSESQNLGRTSLGMTKDVIKVTDDLGIYPIGVALHPYTKWRTLPKKFFYNDDEHYSALNKALAIRRLYAEGPSGLHTHEGVESLKKALDTNNCMPLYNPLIEAMAVNSPFNEGWYTGYKSFRPLLWEGFMPCSGIAPVWRDEASFWKGMEKLSLSVGVEYIQSRGLALDSFGRAHEWHKTWYESQVHTTYNPLENVIKPPTVEVRAADANDPFRNFLIAIFTAALVHQVSQNVRKLPVYDARGEKGIIARWNRDNARRLGLGARFYDIERDRSVTMRERLDEVFYWTRKVDMGSKGREAMSELHRLIAEGKTGADEQLEFVCDKMGVPSLETEQEIPEPFLQDLVVKHLSKKYKESVENLEEFLNK